MEGNSGCCGNSGSGSASLACGECRFCNGLIFL